MPSSQILGATWQRLKKHCVVEGCSCRAIATSHMMMLHVQGVFPGDVPKHLTGGASQLLLITRKA